MLKVTNKLLKIINLLEVKKEMERLARQELKEEEKKKLFERKIQRNIKKVFANFVIFNIIVYDIFLRALCSY